MGNKESVMYLFVIDPNRPPMIIAILDSVRKFGKKILEHAIRNDMNKAMNNLIKSVTLSLPKL